MSDAECVYIYIYTPPRHRGWINWIASWQECAGYFRGCVIVESALREVKVICRVADNV